MHKRAAALVLFLALAVGPASALETFVCSDAAGEVSVEYDYQYDDKDQPFKRVQMQIEDDIGIATDPAHPDYSGEYIGLNFRGEDFRGVNVDWKEDGGRVHSAMKLRLVEISEDMNLVQTGGLSVDGGGLWSITCAAASGNVVAW